MRKVLFAVLMLLPALAWADKFTINEITYDVMDSQLKTVEVGDEGYQFMNSGARYQVINGTTYPYTCMLVNGNFTSNAVTIPSSAYDSQTQKTY